MQKEIIKSISVKIMIVHKYSLEKSTIMPWIGDYIVRLKRIDTFRLFAIFMVVWSHAQFFDGIKTESTFSQGLEIAVVLIARFSMQFFFIASGYFLGGRILENLPQKFAIAWKYSKKLLLFFVVWSAIYAIENIQSVSRLVQKDPFSLLFEGTRIHLWFLMALFLAIWLFTLWPFNKKGYSFLIFGLAVYIIGLLGGSYQITPIGFDLHFNTRNGIFFSVLFFAIGTLIYNKKPKVSPAVVWGLYLGGFALFSLETYFLWAYWSALPIRHDYLLGSIPYGIGAFLIAYTAKRETKIDNFLAPYGKYVLGIYVSHLLFLDLMKPLGNWFNPVLWSFLFPILIFGSSLLTVMLLSKTPLRRFVV
jgi:surface polysaccharide O-acyltransferase-like enzyme